MKETYLEGRCAECGNVCAGAVKIKGIKRSDWEGTAMEFLDGGLIVKIVNKPPSLTGCKDDCGSKS